MKAVEYLPNRLTFFNSEIYYKKENYLKVRTAVFKYITPPIIKGSVYWYVGMLAYPYISTFLYFYVPNSLLYAAYVTWLTPYLIALLVPSVPPFAY